MATETWTVRGPLLVGFCTLGLLVGGVTFWGLQARLAGAVISPGSVEVETNRQVVQHAEGGIVGDVLVRDGDVVSAGDVVLMLDDTLLRSEFAAITAQQLELAARRARMEAERDGLEAIAWPQSLTERQSIHRDAALQIEGQDRLFHARRTTLEKSGAQISEQITQLRNQIQGAGAQLTALRDMKALTAEELADQEVLLERGLTQSKSVSASRREFVRLAGEIGKLEADIAGYRAQIARLNIEFISLESQRREDAITQLRDLQVREIELAESVKQISARLARMEVRTPVSGIVHDTTVFVRDAVVRPGEPLMYIVPQDQPLVVTARVSASHVDEVEPGQVAALRFTSLDQRMTPEIEGRVVSVSADAFTEEATGLVFYRVRISPDEASLAALGDAPILPGMPVETYLRTTDQTPFAYLMKPLADYFTRAMRES